MRFVVGKTSRLHNCGKSISNIVGIGAHKGLRLCARRRYRECAASAEFQSDNGETVRVGGVVVGGDTAIDAARVCKRLGADVTILYRRTRAEMPAIAREVDGALEEGVTIEFLTAPTEVLRDNGTARGLKCIRMELGEPDASGRPKPIPIPGSEFEIEASMIVPAISQNRNQPHWELRDPGVTRMNGRNRKTGIYAGGDDLALALVATAINQGRLAAQAIDTHLRGEDLQKPVAHPEANKVIADWHMESDRHDRPRIPVEQRDMSTEIESGLQQDDVLEEAKRCMSCGMCMDCSWMCKAAAL
jgi:NADPH-dependent glutamate synthase beta subunit-like oxidoreductase